MMTRTSDTIFDAWSAVAFFPVNQVFKLPRQWMRFAGLLLSIPLLLLSFATALPLMLLVIAEGLWDECK